MNHRALILAVAALFAVPACQCGKTPPGKPILKGEGDPCDTDEQCETGLCFALPTQGKKCGRKCATGCKPEEVCTAIDFQRFGCVPKREGLCKACATNSDCPYPADVCISVGGVKVCGRDCSFDNTCPDSFHCDIAHTAEGADVPAQCVPKSGTCDCTSTSIGQQLTCQLSADAGTCTGTRTCQADGYTPCSAKQPMAEVCNGVDDNCNTMVDEGLGDTTCGLGECLRSTANCVNGLPQTCNPGTPTAEICDGKDNDCDGVVDNGIDKNSVMYCGSCTNSCMAMNGTPKCSAGVCAIDTCTNPYRDCDGVYANGCEANTDTSLLHCGMCARPCTAANATPTCALGVCTFVCLPGFGDLDKIAANGCEATCVANDTPDLGFVDTNCDGIDGNESKAIFVDALGGSDANPGTKLLPKQTLAAGIAAAAAATPTKDVYVSKGIYGETVTLASGVSLYGGYDAAAGWARSNTNFTIILSPTSIGISGSGLGAALTVQLFNVNASSASGTGPGGEGLSSYGVLIVNSSGGVTLSAVSVSAGNGSPGNSGATGTPGSPGTIGGNASGSTPGGAGGSACGAAGGIGGAGVNGVANGGTGGTGTQVAGGGLAASGGNPGSAGACSAFSAGNGGNAPVVGANGGGGPGGSSGMTGLAIGVLDAAGLYLPQGGGPGLAGFVGGPGGGGGGGGGTAHGDLSSACANCSGLTSGGGGGGGGGGCGGLPGLGGRGGGGSFGVAALNSVVTIDATRLTSGNGGSGGPGGDGGAGAVGGSPGSGTGGESGGGFCPTYTAGTGANGSSGGQGGKGGGGAGGSGGPSVCIFYKGISPTTNGLQCTTGSVGLGGVGGQGFSQAPTGPSGVGGTVIASN